MPTIMSKISRFVTTSMRGKNKMINSMPAKNKMKCKNNKQKKAAVVVTTKITAAVSIATNNISHTNGVT